MNNTLGTVIRTARLKRGLTQKQLAQRLGLGQSAIAQWEGGTVKPGWPDQRMRLAEVLGLLPLDLLPETDVLPESLLGEFLIQRLLQRYPEGWELLRLMSQLPPAQQEAMSAVVQAFAKLGRGT